MKLKDEDMAKIENLEMQKLSQGRDLGAEVATLGAKIGQQKYCKVATVLLSRDFTPHFAENSFTGQAFVHCTRGGFEERMASIQGTISAIDKALFVHQLRGDPLGNELGN